MNSHWRRASCSPHWKLLKTIGLTLALTIIGAVSSLAQTATTSTITSAAMTATQTTITVASSTGFVASSGTQSYNAWVDGELVKLLSQVGTSTTWNVTRGLSPTRGIAHPTASLVFVGPAVATGPFVMQDPFPGTSCTPTNFQYLPLINVRNNTLWNCISTTVSGGLAATGGGNGSRWNGVSLNKNTATHPVTVIGDANYTALLADEFIVFNKITNPRTITLPAITGIEGKTYVISQPLNSVATLTIQGTSAQLFGSNGTASITMTVTPTRVVSVLMGTVWAWVTW